MNNFLLRSLWYKRRLASMSFGEIQHRSIEQLKRYVSRFYVPNSIVSFDIGASTNTSLHKR